MMRHADVEKLCLSLPGATLSVQWGEERVYKVGGKMFAMMGPKSDKPHHLYFKAGETSFHILTHLRHIIPAPYLARAYWVYLERLDALGSKELKAYLERAHAQVAMGLSKKKRTALGIGERRDA
ncbi:MAG: MmcQ/YjbR family DNA-binding protein [Alphaproteobacteria bacterium]|nr:MmcQ/YjbR family DNA-binding protein [Alphaproteobacteria bacterium]MDE2265126.1 MmcQ/YjbR family DNA-binding protein [Alphaproteobacteria bacterium]